MSKQLLRVRAKERPLVSHAGDTTVPTAVDGVYSTPLLPVEIHCHGYGSVDFSEFALLDLQSLEREAAADGVLVIPTLYLHHAALAEFEAFMHRYDRLRRSGAIPRVVGIALEGPLLASRGGTPASTVWSPTKEEWERLARMGSLGLLYAVISPDALTPASELYHEQSSNSPDLEWIVFTLLAHGVRPALGHFTKADPAGSGARVREILDMAEAAESPLARARVITDHLFNDMPLLIKHAFRTSRARREREVTLRGYELPLWTVEDMPEIVGPVPAAIIEGARHGRLTACLNFDGEHVDLAIAARVAELMGYQNTMMMTDRCDSGRLGGQALHREHENSLWYQSDGVVAAGSQPLDRQMKNARQRSIDENDIWHMAAATARNAFGFDIAPLGGSLVDVAAGSRGIMPDAGSS